MIKRLLVQISLTIILLSSFSFSQTSTVDGENSILNKMIGTWSTKGLSMNQDGTWKSDTTIATWIWYKILQDKAIQDDWYQNTTPDKLEEATSMGTNIRIYNEKEKIWHMGWIDSFNKQLQSFTATEKERVLTMEGHNAQGRPIRNVFSNVTEDRFDWTQQWSFNNGKTWIGVSKIWGYRWEK
jgi:hypothetical protein